MLAQNYKTLLQNTSNKQNLIFGVEFKNPTNTIILYKQHMYSLFLLLYYHGEPQHKAIIFGKLRQLKDIKRRNNQLLSTDASDGDPRKKLHLNEIEMIQFVEKQLGKQEEARNGFHSLAQRQYIRYTFKQIFEMDEALTLKSEMNIADFAKLAAALIKVVVNIKDYYDFQLIQFLEDEYMHKKISKQKQTYRYIKQKTNPKLLNQHEQFYQKSLLFQSIEIEKVQSIVGQSDHLQNQFFDQVQQEFEESLIASPPQSPFKYHKSNSLQDKDQQQIHKSKKVKSNIKMIDDRLNSKSLLIKSKIQNGGQDLLNRDQDLEQNKVALAQKSKYESLQKGEDKLQQTKDQISKLGETSLLNFLREMENDCLEQMPEAFFQQVNKVMQKKVSVHQLNKAMKELVASSKQHIETQEHKEGKKTINQVIELIWKMSKQSLDSKICEGQKKDDMMKSCLKSASHCQKNQKLHDEKSANQIKNLKGVQSLRLQKKSVEIPDRQGFKQMNSQNKQKEEQSTKQTRQKMDEVLSAQKGLQNRTPISSKGEKNRGLFSQNSRPYSDTPHSASYSRPSSPNYHESFSKMINRISQRRQRRLSNTSQINYKHDYGRYNIALKSSGNLHQNNGEIVGGMTSQIYQRVKLMAPVAKEALLYQHADYLSLSNIASKHKYHYPL